MLLTIFIEILSTKPLGVCIILQGSRKDANPYFKTDFTVNHPDIKMEILFFPDVTNETTEEHQFLLNDEN